MNGPTIANEKKRIHWIDNGKAIAICLIVLAHLQLLTLLNDIIFSFVLPAFFFLSGCTFIRTAEDPLKVVLKKRFHGLVVPYFGFSVVLFLFWFFVRRNFGLSPRIDVSPLDVILQILKGANSDFFVTPLWFLTCLFVTEILFWGLHRLGRFAVAIASVLLLPYGVYYWYFMDTLQFSHAFWNVDQLCFYLYFFGLGFVLSKNDWIEKIYVSGYKCALRIFLSVALFIAAFFARQCFSGENSTVLVLLMQLLMCNFSLFAFVGLVKCIPVSPVLNFVGQNTLVILALHLIVQSLLRGVLAALHIDLSAVEYPVVLNIFLTIITLVLLVPAIFFINHFIPWLVGKKMVG